MAAAGGFLPFLKESDDLTWNLLYNGFNSMDPVVLLTTCPIRSVQYIPSARELETVSTNSC